MNECKYIIFRWNEANRRMFGNSVLRYFDRIFSSSFREFLSKTRMWIKKFEYSNKRRIFVGYFMQFFFSLEIEMSNNNNLWQKKCTLIDAELGSCRGKKKKNKVILSLYNNSNENNDKKKALKCFVKLCFSYLFWCSDKTYSFTFFYEYQVNVSLCLRVSGASFN